MSSANIKRWRKVKEFTGEPKLSDFDLVEEQMSTDLQTGEILLEALFLSLDPYMRIEPEHLGPDKTMFSEQVGRVVASKNPAYPVGCVVVAFVGWRTLTVLSPDQPSLFGSLGRRVPDMGNLPASLALGCVGMTGLTAYFGVERGQPQGGQTVLVSAAAGAVGSVAGQIAKMKGCTVVGSAGSKEKCNWLKQLGFDHVFNYKETTVDEALKSCVPHGIDLYIDSVGGNYTYDVVKGHMKVDGRIVVLGAISTYNSDEPLVRDWSLYLVDKQLTVIGTNVARHTDRWHHATTQLLHWGKLHYRETITKGFQHAPQAFIDLMRGRNIGKALVQV
ncbi:hypothetical protein BaRGS_00037772 [Batillaria attramentaria]|uniref:15-oxoprostaglandin 13-reductase n=1 Tax=Batillaria attramentaria TaxID=370345 RepID=A0ABD0J7N1_9CAEN